MKRFLLLAIAAVLLLPSFSKWKAEPPLLAPSNPGYYAAFRHCPTLKCCPDDYCRPPCPFIHKFCGCEANDYCRPPCPFIHRFCGCEPNDYCRPPFPCLLCPPCFDHYTCGTGDCPGR